MKCSANGTGAQRWFYNVSGQILNPPSGKCLDPKKNFTSFPSVVIQTCNTTSLSQQWQIQ
jgi:Ricin-type beta-trefoil lectin domain